MTKFQFSIYYLKELNYRLAYTAVGTLFLFLTTYRYKQALVFIFLPQGLSHFVSTKLTEILFTYLQLCTAISLGFSLALILVQLYLFLRPGLYTYEAKKSLKVLISILCFYFCLYTLIFPTFTQMLWQIFSAYSQNFTPIHLSFEPRILDYLKHLQEVNKILSLSLPFILAISIVQLYINKTLLIRYRSIAYIAIFSAAACITPPDITSQTLVGLPLVAFYEIQIVFWALYKKFQERLLIRQPIKSHKNSNRKKEES